ncbi:hypothetical protein FM106_29815 [Brachybacterium faecium]|nr:hypothetical protein FM106_29815 [Brachybacterium faecium]
MGGRRAGGGRRHGIGGLGGVVSRRRHEDCLPSAPHRAPPA